MDHSSYLEAQAGLDALSLGPAESHLCPLPADVAHSQSAHHFDSAFNGPHQPLQRGLYGFSIPYVSPSFDVVSNEAQRMSQHMPGYMPQPAYQSRPYQGWTQQPVYRPYVGQHPGPRAPLAVSMRGRREVPRRSRPVPEAADSTSSLRGPPTKPRRSGFALWVGNLPPSAQLTELKDFFSVGATQEIWSVFLMAKSNCAFVNYATELACIAAMNRFHNARFAGRNLVCRLRRSPAGGSPSSDALSPSSSNSTENSSPGPRSDGDADPTSPTIVHSPTTGPLQDSLSLVGESPASASQSRVPARFFILKSLTVADLEASQRSCTWSTQEQNESVLGEAFENADDVYLFFSANKSGEYYGIARMNSNFRRKGKDETASTELAESPPQTAGLPRITLTSATATGPAGRIVDDSARGSLFWEADVSEVATDGGNSKQDGSRREFSLEWLSTRRIPFYQTRGLRNVFNMNREVKIARDGTELDPRVGRRLMEMFMHSPGTNGA